MKMLFAVLLMVPSLVQAGEFAAPARINGTQYLFRGAQPLGQVQKLQVAAIDQVLIFKNDVRGEVVRETSELIEAGYKPEKIHHIPMQWKNIDLALACTQTIEALGVLVKSERDEQNTYVHCTAGEDRTGMISGLARMLITRERTEVIFQNELCANSYSDGNPNKPQDVTLAIEQGLTPLFFALADKIESGELNTENLTQSVCQNIKISSEVRRCSAH